MQINLRKQLMTLLVMSSLIISMSGINAYDADNPSTVTMNFIVGEDSSFTVSLAGVETTIDFNPATASSKEVEPDSQSAVGTTPIATITNTGNTDLDFTHILNESLPADIVVCYNDANTVDWSNLLTDASSTIEASVASAASSTLYLWANFTASPAGTRQRDYQINSSVSA